mmetsp:Transcript_45384/g.130162  ORF Transcript_45384/g.130162 Transcript_45384/m.130162 type:complete len:97 (+) Transcript_45384:1133-1423(+)
MRRQGRGRRRRLSRHRRRLRRRLRLRLDKEHGAVCSGDMRCKCCGPEYLLCGQGFSLASGRARHEEVVKFLRLYLHDNIDVGMQAAKRTDLYPETC